MGYMDRELNNPSQSRSGLAAAALRKMQEGNGQSATGNMNAQNESATQKLMSQQSGPLGGAGASGATRVTQGLGRPSVSTTGRVQAPTAATGATGLPFDASAADAQVELGTQNNQAQLDFERAQRDFERSILMGQREVEQSRPNDQRNLLEDFAGRGLAFSSGYGYETGQLENGYADILRQLQESGAEGNADLQRQKALWEQTFQGRLGSIQQAAARRAAEEAERLRLIAESQAQEQAPGEGLVGEPRDALSDAPVDTGVSGGSTGSNAPVGAPVAVQAPAAVQAQPSAAPNTSFGGYAAPAAPSSPAAFNAQSAAQSSAAPQQTAINPNYQSALGVETKQLGNTGYNSGTPTAQNSRELSSFPAAAQKILKNGGIVKAGDGRMFQVIQGVPRVVGT